MMHLMEELTSTENKVAFARQAYNDSVMTYNTQREMFPTNMIAGTFNFGPAELFVIEKPEEKEAPKVSVLVASTLTTCPLSLNGTRVSRSKRDRVRTIGN